jgi:hypothetical protein
LHCIALHCIALHFTSLTCFACFPQSYVILKNWFISFSGSDLNFTCHNLFNNFEFRFGFHIILLLTSPAAFTFISMLWKSSITLRNLQFHESYQQFEMRLEWEIQCSNIIDDALKEVKEGRNEIRNGESWPTNGQWNKKFWKFVDELKIIIWKNWMKDCKI